MNMENDMQYNDKTIVYPLDQCLHELIETQVKLCPDADALWFKGETLSYNELNQRANQCARYLRELGEGPNQIVAVVMERSVEMIVALLGILKAGAAYLPLDPHYPRKRLNLILADAGVSVVLTQRSFEDQLTDFDGTIINLDNEWDYLAKIPNTDLNPVATPDDLAYVIYTSGSTGKPKGCMISHKAICNRLIWMQKQYQVTGNDLILQKTPFTFDVSVWELFLPLLSGACLVIAKPKGHQDNVYLIDTITQKGITICHFVPSMLRFFLNQPRVNQCQSLKHVFVSGEALPAELMKKFKRLLPAKLHNLYGPTEAAVDVTYWECTERADKLVPIGQPIPNIQIYILDSDLKQVPTGESGELYIGGIGLAKGYLNRRELTEKTFIKNPFSKNEHLYKSGDKARYLPDGNIDYLGRLDFQVKLRGLRIELGEIELTLNAHEAVDQSIVMVKDQDTSDPKLVAYIVTKQDINHKQLREFLKKELPEYMVPNIFVPMADIPVTQHGKADRKSLPWPIHDTEPARLPDPEPIEPKQDTSKLVSELVRMFSELLNITKIQANDDLFDLGATSFTIVQVVEKIQNRHGVVIPVDVFLDDPNVAAIAAYVEKKCDNNCKKSSSSKPAQSKSAAIKLQSADFSDTAYPMDQRNFSGKTVSFAQFGRFLGLLKQGRVDDKSKYLYPSSGGLNSTQTYLFIKKDGVASLQEGVYYYHPIEHSLYPLAVPAHIDPAIMGEVNRERFNQCGFALFLIVQLNAIWPIYKILSPSLSVLDAGYISQLLLNRGQEFGLTLSPAVGVDFSQISGMFLLEKSHRFIHCILGGNPDMASSATDLLTGCTRNWIFDHCKDYTFSDYLNVKNKKHTLPTKQDKKDLKQDAYLRQFPESFERIRLEPVPNVDEAYYRARSTKRDYVDQPIPFSQFSLFLSLLAPKRINGQPRFLYSSLIEYRLKYYLYIQKNGVEGVPEGVYRYDPERLSLHLVTSALSKNIKLSHYPFNRTHVQKSKFCLFLFAPLADLTPVYKEESTYIALLEAGIVGQLLMDKQAEFEIGVCPIGGMRFDKIRSDFEQSEHALQPTDELLHSFVGGNFKVEMPADWNFLAAYRQRQLIISDTCQRVEQSATDISLNQDIAIVGISGRYPGATNLEEYWNNLKEGISSFSELWFDQAVHYRRSASDSQPFRHYAAFLDDVDCFDSLLFNITPAEAKQLDPQERLMLEVVWECLENAGYTSEELNQLADKVGVFVGAMWSDYQHHAMDGWKHSQNPLAMSHHSAIPSRVSYFFDFNGPCISLDTSCSSALAAIHYACNSLNNKECQAAIVGGVNIMSHPYHHGLLKSLDLLSADDECHPFGAKGNGWIAGEGVGAILIKPKIDALKDGDTIHGIIKGSAVGHSGKSSRYGAPNAEKQAEFILSAIKNAAISPESISYIEAAASGASMADASEMMAVKTVFKGSTQSVVGSVKSNIGHLESASAMSQLAKVLLQMKHQQICPTRRMSDLNPMIRLEDSNLKIINQLTPWMPQDGTPRRALINAFGATGTSGHLVVEEYIAPNSVESDPDSRQLIILSAATKPQLMDLAKRLNTFLANSPHRLSDIAHTLRIGRIGMSERLAIVTDSHAELQEKLTNYINGSQTTPGVYTGSHAGFNEKTLPNDLDDIAKAWVSETNYDWKKLVTGNEKRVPLPTYPFAKERHWIEDNPPTEHTVKQIEFYLKRHISNISEIPVSRIHSKALYDQFGMTSQMITQLTLELENDFGRLSKTLFFEYQTIHDLALYFLQNHSDQLSQVIAGDKLCTPSVSPQPTRASTNPVAIIGVAGRYPKSNNLNEFWDNLKNGVDCISEIPTQRWNYSDYDQEDFAPGTRLSKWGGFIEGVDQFDPLFFNISPREAELMDPQERLFLQTVWEMFEDAGYSKDTRQSVFNRKIGVFVGVMYGEYQLLSPSLRGHGIAVGSAYGSIANRISFFFDLKGPSLALDTLCSSSLTALHLAVGSIQSGECNGAIVGGVNISIHPNKYIRQAQLNMPSTDGRCRSFGEGGDGFIPGEGVGAVLLKPLDKAVADNDHIYAVINGTAINHDGKTHGYTVPNPNAQAEMIADALKKASIDPRQISYVEAHGTGTALGDPVEITGLTQAFGDLKDSPRTCAIGSVKSNIGHLESAAGIAGLTKILLQFKHGQLVPSLHSKTLNPNIDFETGPFYVQQELTEWKKHPRIACISSFGAGGANAHAILSEYDDKSASTNPDSAFLIPLSAKNWDRLQEVAKRLLEFVQIEVNEGTIDQIAYTLQVGRDALEYRLGMVVHSTQELQEKLKRFLAGEQTGIYLGQVKHTQEEAVFETEDDILELWVKGATVDWSKLVGPNPPKKISLPTYPFANDRYWVPEHQTSTPCHKELEQNNLPIDCHPENNLPIDCHPDNRRDLKISKDFSLRRNDKQNNLPIDCHPENNLPIDCHPENNLPIDCHPENNLPIDCHPDNRRDLSRLLAIPVWRESPIQKNQDKPLDLVRQIILCELPQINDQIVESHFHRCVKLSTNESTIDGRLTEYAIQCFFHIRQIIDQNRPTTKHLIQLVIPNEGEPILFTALSGLFKTAALEHSNILGQVLQVSPVETTQSLVEKLIDNGYYPQDDVVRYTKDLEQNNLLIDCHFDDSLLIDCHFDDSLLIDCHFDDRRNLKDPSYCRDDKQGNDFVPSPKLKRFVTAREIVEDQKEVTKYGFRDKGVYLITGGLGGLGSIFANEIVQKTNDSTLILTGSSELSVKKQAILKRLQEQNKTIHIEYRQTDVSNQQQTTDLIKSICDQYGTLVGIIHCAGTICDNLIVKKSEDEFRQVLAPKVSGTLNLDRATAELDLELFVLFSSISGVTGNLGQADYAVANGFLDQFAHYRAQLVAAKQRHGVTISINWPLWEEGGMDIDEASKRMMIQSTGLIPLQTTTGIQSFYKCIAIAQPQIMVTEGSFEKIKNTFFTAHPAPKSQAVHTEVDPKTLREKTLYRIKRLFGEEIKLPAAQVDETEPLESYGIDSVMIAHLNQKLMDVFGDIPRTLFFEYQTLDELTDYFVANFAATCCAWSGLDRLQEKVSIPDSHDTNQPERHLSEQRFEPIAIIGISGLYPQAPTLEQYWENLKSGKNCITEIPPERWSLDSFYEPTDAIGKSYSKWGGFLDSFANFDPLFFNISPKDAKQMDPQERLFLQTSWQAMENAGYTRSMLKEIYQKRVGVFAGITRSEFNMYGYYTSFSSVANRLSFFLDIQGPSMPVDTMCSSSLTAIHEACQYIHSGDCQLAFAGGVNLYLHPSGYVSLCSQKMLSQDGLCKSFGLGGDGFVPGEGVGVVILKRLSAAIADRDSIHAVIRATHVNHGGKTNGYTVPNPTAQADLIRHTLDKAGLTADQISYVEAHGTGTELGDPIEIAGLTQAFQKDTQATGFCKIGSVKSNIGHLESAAGIAGLTKIILQMKHGQIAPSLHAQTLNPNIRFETTPFVVNQTLTDWEQPMCNGKRAPRRAGISSFGAGGSNAHIIVEEYLK
jgi:amino acid adenylation domain-containing protein